MGMVFVVNHMTLDGVMQSPGRADEDPRDGFAHGGWAQAANDPMMMRAMAPRLAADGALLLGVLLRSLLPHGLIDRWILLIHPLILGAGRRMFGEGSPAGLRLADSVTTSTGVIIATYVSGGDR